MRPVAPIADDHHMPDIVQHPMKAFVARQPIVDGDRALIGYELLFRSALDATQANVSDGAQATANVVDRVGGRDFASLTGGVLGFVNFEHETLTSDFPRLLQPPEAFVIELLESVPPDTETLERIDALCGEGFRCALDDVTSPDRLHAFAPRIAFAEIDWSALESDQRREIVSAARALAVRTIVKRVETDADFAEARQLGCDFFQGFLFGRPRTMERAVMPVVDTHLFQLLNTLGGPTCNPETVAEMVGQDVGLTHRILRFAGSAHAAQRAPGLTIPQAAMLLGYDGIRRVVALQLVSRMVVDASPYLAARALARARFCEDLCRILSLQGQTAEFFLAGLLSTMDALLRLPMAEAVVSLPLPPSVAAALVEGEGVIGQTLRLVEAYEAARWEQVGAVARSLGAQPELLPESFHRAVTEGDRLALAA